MSIKFLDPESLGLDQRSMSLSLLVVEIGEIFVSWWTSWTPSLIQLFLSSCFRQSNIPTKLFEPQNLDLDHKQFDLFEILTLI